MKITCVGSVALDTIETPFGKRRDILGGSATYFSIAASYFTPVGIVGVVGSGFPQKHRVALSRHPIDFEGLETVEGPTFRWHGRYEGSMNYAKTVSVKLGVFDDFQPRVPDRFRTAELLFLAKASPVTQEATLRQMRRPRFVLCDTMDLWITTKRDGLRRLLGRVNALTVNNDEALQLTGKHNLIAAGRKILSMGPRVVLLKRGEHGATLMTASSLFSCPAFPVERPKDPTGAGDAFAGGFLGALARRRRLRFPDLKRALVAATVMASFAVEDFGVAGLWKLSPTRIRTRIHKLQQILAL